MRKLFIAVVLLYCSHSLVAQDTVITLSKDVVTKQYLFYINDTTGWVYHKGNDIAYASPGYNTDGWQNIKPYNITKAFADKDGNIEGWFRIKVLPDSSFNDQSLNLIYSNINGSAEIYIDGKLVKTYGSTNLHPRSFEKANNIIPLVPGMIQVGKVSVIAIHYKNKLPSFPESLIFQDSYLKIYAELANERIYDGLDKYFFYSVLWVTTCTLLALLFWLLAFQNRREKNIWLIAACASCFSISSYTYYAAEVMHPLFISAPVMDVITILSNGLIVILMIAITSLIFTNKISRFVKSCIVAFAIMDVYSIFGSYYANIVYTASIVSGLIILFYYVIACWRKIKGPQWAIVFGIICAATFGSIYFIQQLLMIVSTFGILSIAFLSLPVSLLIYVSLRFREIIKEVRANAAKIVEVTEEKRQQALNQQKVLQEEVNRQTADLRTTLNNLRSTQAQLIQSEKMASLGELTAGIAHEIQNPLNFVNNFSEVNMELIEELKNEKSKIKSERDEQLETDILDDIKSNEEKINHHGKRADSIVKGMLQHSRASSSQKELTDINALCDEYVRLCYHGIRAKDNTFNATIHTDFDKNAIPLINMVPQNIGRVLLNLFNNAFFAVNEKTKLAEVGYEPTVTISTRKEQNRVIISVSDNGNGIPENIIDKIFQPFFTTKPTGQGTGLGLSLSYDIITKEHSGIIKAESKSGKGSIFIVELPFA